MKPLALLLQFFYYNDTPTTEIYTLSLHDALPIYDDSEDDEGSIECDFKVDEEGDDMAPIGDIDEENYRLVKVERSEEHTSELQSHSDLVCRLLLEKKKKKQNNTKNI